MELKHTPPLPTWYEELIDECETVLIEGLFTSRWVLIETYHSLGSKLLETNDNFEREKIYGKNILQDLAKRLRISERTLRYSIQFARQYPDLDELPDGKNISWTKIVRDLLPAKEESKPKLTGTKKAKHDTLVSLKNHIDSALNFNDQDYQKAFESITVYIDTLIKEL